MKPFWIIKKGSTRIVWILPYFNCVLKFPVIRPLWAISEVWFYLKLRNWSGAWESFTRPPRYPYSVRWCLLNGIISNWREYRFYKRTKYPFLWPTTLSIFGLINIQPIGKKPGLTTTQIWVILSNIAGKDIWKDNHCFANDDNFCVDAQGKLRLLDYSSVPAQQILKKHAAKFAQVNGSPPR